MNGILLLIVGISVAINIMVIKVKIEKKRYLDAALDGTILGILTVVFGGSFNGLITATVASSVVSMWLWFVPPKINFGNKPEKKKSNNPIVNDLSSSFEQIVREYKNNK